jgi:SAM-dependent methyltransferase
MSADGTPTAAGQPSVALAVAAVSRSCAACGGYDATPLYRDLVRCDTCGMVYYPRRLSRDEVCRLYAEGYFKGEEYFDYLADRAVHLANFRARQRQLARWLPHGKRVFEIGCSYGLFLHTARDRWRVAGCDVAVEPSRYAHEALGLDVHCAEFSELPLAPGEVDAFCLWDTIEHLNDPARELARMAEVLQPGGLLALTTGDIGSRLARRQGPRWRQIHPPTHVWYFSPETMRRTLERFGFEVVEFRHVGMWRSVGQIVYSLTSLGRTHPSWVHHFSVRSGLGRLRVWLNTFDLMFVVARRTAAAHGT